MFGLFSKKKPPSYEQKRKLKRVSCRYLAMCEDSGAGLSGTVTDLGTGGMRMTVLSKVKAGASLKVTYRPDHRRKSGEDLSGAPVTLEVRWCRLKKFANIIEAGGVFVNKLEGTWVEAALNELGLSAENARDRRTTVRALVNPDFELGLQIGHPSLGTLVGKVENMCTGGALVIVGHPLEVGGNLQIAIGPYYHLKELALHAVVSHQQEYPLPDTFCFGLAFPSPNPAQSALLLQYIQELLKAQAES